MSTKELSVFVAAQIKAGVIVHTGDEHAGALNHLAMEGKLTPCEFTAFDGIRRKALSTWAATTFLKSLGQYASNVFTPPVYHYGE